MGLECLILTGDPALLSDLRSTLAARGISLQYRQDSDSAIELASRRHLDGLVVDCDVPGSAPALEELRNSAANKQTLILLCQTSRHESATPSNSAQISPSTNPCSKPA